MDSFSLLLLLIKIHPNKGHGEGETWSIKVLGTLMYIFVSRTKRMTFPLRKKPFFAWTLKLLQILPPNLKRRECKQSKQPRNITDGKMPHTPEPNIKGFLKSWQEILFSTVFITFPVVSLIAHYVILGKNNSLGTVFPSSDIIHVT